MKTVLIAATALSLLAAPAFAQNASSTINLGGTVAKACGLGNHISGSDSNVAWAQGDISAIPMTDAEGQFNGYTSGQRSFGNMWCNTAADVSLTVTSFSTANSTTDTGSFANSFDVKVTSDTSVYWSAGHTAGGVVQSSGTTDGVGSGNMPGAFETGTGRYSGLVVEILPVIGSGGNNKRPVAGDYTAAITLTATAT
jgi:hypothetical protein